MISQYIVYTDRWSDDEFNDDTPVAYYDHLNDAIKYIDKEVRKITPRLIKWSDDKMICRVYYEDAGARLLDYSYYIDKTYGDNMVWMLRHWNLSSGVGGHLEDTLLGIYPYNVDSCRIRDDVNKYASNIIDHLRRRNDVKLAGLIDCNQDEAGERVPDECQKPYVSYNIRVTYKDGTQAITCGFDVIAYKMSQYDDYLENLIYRKYLVGKQYLERPRR